MTDRETAGSGGECEPHAMRVCGDAVVVENDRLRDPISFTHLRRSMDSSPQLPVLSDIKIEMVKVEDVEHDGQSELGEYNHRQEIPRVLTADDVATEKIFDNEVIDSKSELAFVVGQGRNVCNVCKKCFISDCGQGLEMKCTQCCSFRTEFIDNMQSHVALNHQLSKEPKSKCDVKHKCQFCDHEAKKQSDLVRHLKIHCIRARDRPICSGCRKSFKTNDSLKKHVKYCQSLTEFIQLKCKFCNYQSKVKTDLLEHIRRVHPGEIIDSATCKGCGKSFKNRNSLKYHIRFCEQSNNKILKFKCFHCSHETKWKKDLKIHIRCMHPIGPIERAICFGCGRSYKGEYNLKKHLKRCEESNPEILKYKCFYCAHETKWKGYLVGHIRRKHHIKGMDRPSCRGCRKFFKNKRILRKHVKYCPYLKHKCPFCDHETKRAYALRQHMETQHPVGPIEPAVCSGCGKTYKHHDRLKRHIPFCEKWNHDLVKFRCFHCRHETTHKGYLKDHIKRVHPVDGIDPVTCTGCGKYFKNTINLKKHMKKYCEKLNTEVIKLKCEFCNFTTKRPHYLKKHMEKPHVLKSTDRAVCSGCGKSYKHHNRLRNHIPFCDKANNEIVKFKCHYCYHETTQKNYLRDHIKRVHPLESIDRPTCTACGKSYKSKIYLKEHMKYCEKLNTDVIKLKCEFCNFTTKRPHYLKKHMEKPHVVESTYRVVCPGCGKSYKDDVRLRKHIPFCEKSNSEIVKLKCFHCHHETTRKIYLRDHIKRQHPVELIDHPTCTACGKSYKSKIYLKEHMKCCEMLNSGMQLKCEFCDHETKWIGDLRKHIKTQHSVEKADRITCSGCGKCFKNRNSLRNHMRYCEKLNNDVVKLKCKYCDHETKRQGDMTRHIVRLHYNVISAQDIENL